MFPLLADELMVSILVLMEVLREADQITYLRREMKNCFNPCFNGSVERGRSAARKKKIWTFCFNPCFNGSVERGTGSGSGAPHCNSCFNPCFNGSVERGLPANPHTARGWRFNPCFNGSVERGRPAPPGFRYHPGVSILVLMEVLREDAGIIIDASDDM